MASRTRAAIRKDRLHEQQLDLQAEAAAAGAAATERERAVRVLEAVGDGIFLVDSEGIVRFWNRAAELITGLDRSDALDRRIRELVAEWPAIEASVQTATADGPPRPMTVPVELDGGELWLWFLPVRIPAGISSAFRAQTRNRGPGRAKTTSTATVRHGLR